MKYFREVMIFVIAVLLFGMVIGAMLNAGDADAQVVGFGNLEAELRRLAQQDTERFIDAMKVGLKALEASQRTLFTTTMKSELGLDDFATDQKKVKELSEAFARVEVIATPESFALIKAYILQNIVIKDEPND